MNKVDFPFDILKANLYNILDAYIEFAPSNNVNTDGILKIWFDGRQAIDLEYVFINNNTNPTFQKFYGLYQTITDVVFVAESFSTPVKNELKANGIKYIELSGNCFIKTTNYFIYVTGNKKVSTKKAKPNRAFSKTGLKIILYYLTEENNINMPSRDLAKHLQIGYSNIHYVNQGLKELKYLIPKNKNTLILDKRKELLNRWISNYEEKIKPNLFEGSFKFRNEVDLKNWRNLKTETNFQWGGEAAAALLTNNLEPKIFTIYTNELKSGLIKKYKLIPDEEGYIFVYKPLHSLYTSHYLNATHPILIYADLIISQESRNIEAANKIYEQYIQY